MRTVRRLLYRDIVGAVVFVALAFLALFFFVDFVDQLGTAMRRGYPTWTAVAVSLLEAPGNLYELLPIAVLIGTIFSLARLAQSTQFTILRTSGLGPGRALALLATLGAVFAVATLLVGDYVAPWADQRAQRLLLDTGGARAGTRGGAWLKDRYIQDGQPRSVSVHVQRLRADGELRGVRLFVFDDRQRLVEQIVAESARIDDDAVWHLKDVELRQWPVGSDGATPAVTTRRLDAWQWPGTLRADVVKAAVLPPNTMSTVELWAYVRHLRAQAQDVQRYEIQFWKKALYPLACLVMVALALPFAYLHARSGGISVKVFGGVMLGTSFMLLNSLAGHLGTLRDWTPWLAAGLPGIVYLSLSLAAFAWLVRYR
ncbi:LPS export ABC transporter permease LptG [Azohydromonas sediminis]|uniref:LPS export ABC transporter permease LptG n=1 Tax=Azohydromonas sediminis TaxID=2259674 RepID=UPI000E659150|nr:LPS export ABC transporter permease LptG [Azohydromonas sediminis]